MHELIEAINMCKVKFLVEEHKSYSKDWLVPGRIKVELLDDLKKPVNMAYRNSKTLMMKRMN